MTPLPPERLLLPFEAGPYRMAMGLTACPADDLVELDERYLDEMAERRELLASRHHDVFATTPGSEAARAEVLELIAALLPRRHPDWFAREGPVLHNRLTGEGWDLANPEHDPLELAGRLVQEDLCVIDASGAAPVLAAAILCAPTSWRLREKIGLPLAEVHVPVPMYADRLSAAVDRFMAALKPGRVAERQNWGMTDDPALFQQWGKHRTALESGITAANAPDRLFFRMERQTLVRLPASGAVLFVIRVHCYPLRRVLGVPGAGAELAAALRAMPEALTAYKSLPRFRDALLACLDAPHLDEP